MTHTSIPVAEQRHSSRLRAGYHALLRRPRLVILLLALLLRLGVLAIIWISTARLDNPLDSRAFNGGDSRQYIRLAENMVEHGAFSLQTKAPFTPDLIRTPGYPAVLAVLYVLAGHHHSPVLIIAVQVALSVLNVGLVLRLGERLFSARVARWAGVIYAFAPATLIFTGLVMTETLFATLLLSALLLVERLRTAEGQRAWWIAVLAGLCLGMGALVRPVGLYFVPLPMLVMIAQHPRRRVTFGHALALGGVGLLCLLPWYYRNWKHYDTLIFTSIANNNLLSYNTASIAAQSQSIPLSEAQAQLWDDYNQRLTAHANQSLNPAQQNQIAGEVALDWMRAHPLDTLLYQAWDVRHVLRPGYSMSMLLLRDEGEQFGVDIQAGNLSVLDDSPVEALIFIVMTVYYAGLYATCILGGLALLRRRAWITLLLLGLTLGWFLCLPGLAGNARFRAPVEGLLALVAASGISVLGDVWTRYRARRGDPPVDRRS